ncbi:MAG: DUF2167 domain-containing protein [Burkholderiales bacterium]
MTTTIGAQCARMLLVLGFCISAAACAHAAETDRQKEVQAAFSAAQQTKTKGPSTIPLADQAVLKLPQGFVYVPQAEGARILSALGNRPGDGLLGLVFPEGTDDWLVVLRLYKSGFIKDGDAKDWKADELLAGLKDGTEEVNKERRERGIPEMEIIGWIEPPAYDAATNRLVWSLSSKHKNDPGNAAQGVNYNTYALGREGYIGMNLVTEASLIQEYKPTAHRLLGELEFNQGKRYADFNSSTDRIAEYGLAALIGGVAAKTLGLLAVMGAFFLKFTKLIAIGAIAVVAGIRQWFARKKSNAPNPPPAK